MTYGRVPHFDRPISRVAIGSMALSMDHLDLSLAVLEEYVNLGGNAVDTAHCYGPTRHAAVGEFLRLKGRDSLILLDKGCHPYGHKRVTRADLESDLLENQTRMQISHTDFFVLHRDDPDVPAGQVIDWLNEQKNLGRVTGFGASNWATSRIQEANDYAAATGQQGFSFGSPNLALAHPQDEMWPGAVAANAEDRKWYATHQLPLFSWSSGAGGFFAGLQSDDVKRVYFNEENFARKARAEELANKYGVSPTQIAVAWTLAQPLNVFAITGPKNVEEVRDNMAVIDLKLTPEEVVWLETGIS
jgi:aryl-alcohol dehydrogenase-like predicted oxidoreductase